jgi:predicted acylesterase/phospholipase RssA/CRP-like cAMP-binding protein
MDEPGVELPHIPLVALVATHDLFRSLDLATLADLEAELSLVRLAPGATLFRQGDAGDGMYVLVEGCLSIRFHPVDGVEIAVDEMRPLASVGEMALLTGQPRSATAIAAEASVLVRLGRAGFDRLAARHPHAMRDFAQTLLPRLHRTQLASALAGLFGPIEGAALRELQALLEWRHLPAGTTLFRQGEPGDELAIVVNGRLRIVVERPERAPQTVGEVSRGECVGEFALLTGQPRSATVHAVRDSDVVLLSQALFERLLAQYPRAMLQIARAVIAHAPSPARGDSSATTITFALIPAGPTAPLADVARRLVDALSAFGPTLHLSGERLDALFGRHDAAQTDVDDLQDVALKSWLTEQEAIYRYLVYEADRTWSPWTRRCLRQADRTLIVGRAGADSAPGEVERGARAAGGHARAELVLVHPDDCPRPAGTAAWLDQRDLHTHHHVRLGVAADYGRLARRMTGRAIGLVLSGGGSRGLAHIGVIRALEEAGLAADMIGGTSMGALIGAGYAIDRGYAEQIQLAEAFSRRSKVFDFTLPLTSFFAARKLTGVFRELFEDIRIEDLWRPFFAVSSNLTRAEPVIHDRGLLWACVRASTAIPGVFAPVLRDGDVVVDGGVMNNFPIDIMREAYEAGTVIGVNVSPPTEKLKDYRFGDSVSGWQVLWSRVSPFGGRVRAPSLLASLIRATEINGAYKVRSPAFQRLADLVIQPPVVQFHPLDFDAYQALIAAGYDEGRAAIAAWSSSLASSPAGPS